MSEITADPPLLFIGTVCGRPGFYQRVLKTQHVQKPSWMRIIMILPLPGNYYLLLPTHPCEGRPRWNPCGSRDPFILAVTPAVHLWDGRASTSREAKFPHGSHDMPNLPLAACFKFFFFNTQLVEKLWYGDWRMATLLWVGFMHVCISSNLCTLLTWWWAWCTHVRIFWVFDVEENIIYHGKKIMVGKKKIS